LRVRGLEGKLYGEPGSSVGFPTVARLTGDPMIELLMAPELLVPPLLILPVVVLLAYLAPHVPADHREVVQVADKLDKYRICEDVIHDQDSQTYHRRVELALDAREPLSRGKVTSRLWS
jgi:hypothetical protein